MKIKTIHTGILVKSIETSVNFYETVLGFKRQYAFELDAGIMNEAFGISKPAKVQMLACDAGSLELFEFEGSGGGSAPITAGINHFALEVENLEEYINNIRSKGGSLKSLKKGEKTIWFAADPDGVLIELKEIKP